MQKALLLTPLCSTEQTLTRLPESSRSRSISGSRSRTRSQFRGILSLGLGPGLGLEAGTIFGPL